MNRARKLPDGFTEDMIMRHPSRNIMNKLARSVLALYSYDDNPDDTSIENMLLQSIKLVGCFPSIVANAYAVKRHYFQGDSLHIHFPVDDLSTAENFLRMIRPDKSYTEEEAHLLDMMLMLHAEHGGGNNSTFVCRALSSSGTDTYSAIAGAVGSLKGPLHGGANAKVVSMHEDIRAHVSNWEDEDEVAAYLGKILDKQAFDGTGLIYGMGHAVYSLSDPRAEVLRTFVQDISKEKGLTGEMDLYLTVEKVAKELLTARTGKPVAVNVDFYSGFLYDMLGLPKELYTPLFAIARMAGWSAHRMEELGENSKIIRPACKCIEKRRPYTPMAER
jgi:citrate synthase